MMSYVGFEIAISSNKVWKAAGMPQSGPIFQHRKSDKLAYKIKIREDKENEQFSYSNSLHDALSEKESGEFWKCWRAKFWSNNNFVSRQVNGLADKKMILRLNLLNISPSRVLPIVICVMLN